MGNLPTGSTSPNSVSFYSSEADRWFNIDPRTIPITSLWSGTATANQLITVDPNGYNIIGIDIEYLTQEELDLLYIKIADGAAGVSFDNTGTGLTSVTVQDVIVELNNKVDAETAAFFVGDTPPVAPIDGTPWYNSATGRLYVYYNDGTSSQWVDPNPAIVGGNIAGLVTYNNNASGLPATTVQGAIDLSWLMNRGTLVRWTSATETELLVSGLISRVILVSTGIYEVELAAEAPDRNYTIHLQAGARISANYSQLTPTYYDKTTFGFRVALLDDTTPTDPFTDFELNIKVNL